MNGSTPRHLLHFVARCLRLRRYLKDPGEGRPQPQIPAQVLLWALLIGWLLAMLALTIERLYRLRYLHRGKHPVPSSAQLLLQLWLSRPRPTNSS